MFRTLSVVAASLLLTAPALAQDSAWKIDPAHTNAQFTVRHMMISNVRGEFNNTTGTADFDGNDPSKAKVEATIDVSSINTREPKRDEHLKGPDFFDAAKYPNIKFVSKKIEKAADGKYKMTGDLTIHGVTKEVVLDVDGPSPMIKDPHGNQRVGASATTKINRKDFGLTWNGALDTGGALIGDDIGITIDVELMKKQSSASSDEKAKPAKNG